MNSDFALVKHILENLRTADRLDNHPWVNHLFVQEWVSNHPGMSTLYPGYKLAAAVSDLFRRAIPGTPPRRGKRLDTQWGAFGILAAQYFAPFLFGAPYPGSLRDAWGKIDQAILLFRFGKDRISSLSEEEINQYALVRNEPDVTPISTISDWQKKGIEQLVEVINDRENHLGYLASNFTPTASADPGGKNPSTDVSGKGKHSGKTKKSLKLPILGGSFLILTLVILFLGIKGWKVYQFVEEIRKDIPLARELASLPKNPEKIQDVQPVLEKLHADIGALRSETTPYLRILGPWLRWVPEYGEDLAASDDLLELADRLTSLLLTTYDTAAPIYLRVKEDTDPLTPQILTEWMAQAQPQFVQARRELDEILALRAKINPAQLSPRVQGLLNEVDNPLGLLDKALYAAVALPRILGASSDGPKTYIVLIQNEDELRATGGFITAVFKCVVKDGNLIGLEFEDTDNQEDWSLPYPSAPWQLREYMNSPVLVLRDANWFPDYPTTVGWVEFLYAYKHQHSLDGIIAIDQQFLVALLSVIGPINVAGYDTPVSAGNVVEFMREAKTPPVQPQPKDWTRKESIKKIGYAIIEQLSSGLGDVGWQKMAETILRMLDERHILLQVDDSEAASILADLGWDGAIKPVGRDYFMLVDSNIGFNKANPAVSSKISYDVNLAQLTSPTASLSYDQTNKSPSTRSCVQFGSHELDEARYPIYYCYWNYLRVYVPAETRLVGATPQQIPADWMILKKGVSAKVDELDDEIAGIRGYGTLVVVPGGQTKGARFDFALPAGVVIRDPETNVHTYSLKIQKQPGTGSVPVTLRVHLPSAAVVTSVNMKALTTGTDVLVETNLRKDVNLSVVFSLP